MVFVMQCCQHRASGVGAQVDNEMHKQIARNSSHSLVPRQVMATCSKMLIGSRPALFAMHGEVGSIRM